MRHCSVTGCKEEVAVIHSLGGIGSFFRACEEPTDKAALLFQIADIHIQRMKNTILNSVMEKARNLSDTKEPEP